jgi:hypothetical protein
MLPGEVPRQGRRGNAPEFRASVRFLKFAKLCGTLLLNRRTSHAAKFARQKVPGGTLLAIPAGPIGNKIPVISKASRRANSGTQIAKWIWATDLGGRFGRRACVPPERLRR